MHISENVRGQRLSRAVQGEEVTVLSNADQMALRPSSVHGQILGYLGV